MFTIIIYVIKYVITFTYYKNIYVFSLILILVKKYYSIF